MPFDFLIHKMLEAQSVSLTLLFLIEKLEISERSSRNLTLVTQYYYIGATRQKTAVPRHLYF